MWRFLGIYGIGGCSLLGPIPVGRGAPVALPSTFVTSVIGCEHLRAPPGRSRRRRPQATGLLLRCRRQGQRLPRRQSPTPPARHRTPAPARHPRHRHEHAKCNPDPVLTANGSALMNAVRRPWRRFLFGPFPGLGPVCQTHRHPRSLECLAGTRGSERWTAAHATEPTNGTTNRPGNTLGLTPAAPSRPLHGPWVLASPLRAVARTASGNLDHLLSRRSEGFELPRAPPNSKPTSSGFRPF
ncbi:hypothetical protein QFZ75_004975 [Streptomyces sp. V3I8]|nr:hypothetical protein [Streptomyces sp. V3I8]